MTRIIGPPRSQRRRWWILGAATAAMAGALVFSLAAAGAPKPPPTGPAGPYQVPTGTIGQASGFADNDGNTEGTNTSSNYNPTATADPNANNQPTFDWNSIASNPSYSDTSDDQYGAASGTKVDPNSNTWHWTALNDAAVDNADTSFAGGVKQDFDCPGIDGSKAPNKDDLKRAYIAAATVGGHTYLNLAWVRIPQNTTSSSAHIGFEFNQNGSTNACGAGSDGLVHRHGNDMLLVFDFTGGSTVPPEINLSRWVTAPSGTCQVGADSPPCWGVFTDLTTAGFAEANVDTSLSHICDSTLSRTGCQTGESDHSSASATPPTKGTKYVLPFQAPDNLAPSNETLGTSEFGEAGIDLTASGVFGAGGCVSFGSVFAVSRSSGDSNTAAMEDLVGPGHFSLSNCTASTSTAMQKSTDNFVANTATLSNGDTITSGTYVRDRATVSVTGTSSWSGNVDFYLCKSSSALSSCDHTNPGTGVTQTQVGGDVPACNTGGTCSPSNGPTATSASTQVSDAGHYCWEAVFTHTSPTDLPDGDPSMTGECFTVTAPATIATNPWVYPQDRAVISASSGGNLAGSVAFKLFGPTAGATAAQNCAANTSTGLLYSESGLATDTVSGTSPQTVDTSNGTLASGNFRITASTASNLVWRVTYTSTNNSQTGSSSVCIEQTGVSITADGTVSFS